MLALDGPCLWFFQERMYVTLAQILFLIFSTLSQTKLVHCLQISTFLVQYKVRREIYVVCELCTKSVLDHNFECFVYIINQVNCTLVMVILIFNKKTKQTKLSVS